MAQTTHIPATPVGVTGSSEAGGAPPNLPAQGLSLAKACASVFGGGTGYHGDILVGKMAFAELSNNPGAQDFSALGNLPYKTKLIIKYKGKAVIAQKLDVGAGGGGCGGHARKIDLYADTAAALGFASGLDVVEYQVYTGNKTAGSSILGISGEILEGIPNLLVNPGAGLQALKGEQPTGLGGKFSFGDLEKVIKFIGSGAGWTRIGKVLLGAILLIMALVELTKVGSSAPSIPSKAASAGVGAGVGKVTSRIGE